MFWINFFFSFFFYLFSIHFYAWIDTWFFFSFSHLSSFSSFLRKLNFFSTINIDNSVNVSFKIVVCYWHYWYYFSIRRKSHSSLRIQRSLVGHNDLFALLVAIGHPLYRSLSIQFAFQHKFLHKHSGEFFNHKINLVYVHY